MEENNVQMNENVELNAEEKKDEKKSKGRLADVLMTLLAIAVLVVCYFFWGCKYDLPATILAIVVILAGSALIYMQHKRANKDEEKKAEA